MLKLVKLGAVVGCCSVAMGCGAASLDAEAEEGFVFDEQTEGLSATEQCGTLTSVHKTTDGEPGDFTTTDSYDPANCHDGYLINADNYVGAVQTTFNSHLYLMNYFFHAEVAGGKAACEKQRVMLYVWKKNGTSSPDYLGTVSKWGSWTAQNSSCSTAVVPNQSFGIGLTQTSTDYRFALGARTYATAGDPNSAYTRKAIKSSRLSAFVP
jgi:hypothetical protein